MNSSNQPRGEVNPAADRAARILVVDDEPGVRLGCVFALKSEGWSVEGEGSSPAAFTRLQTEPPDLIVLDYMMPGLDGLTLIRGVAAPRPSVLLMSAHADGTVIAEALQLGIVDFLEKPLVPVELRTRVRRLLERRQQMSKEDDSGASPSTDAERRRHALGLGQRGDWDGVRDYLQSLPPGQTTPALALIKGLACDLLGDADGAAAAFALARFPADWRKGGPEIMAWLARSL
jgi:CheY-like chemotaxis protein